MSSMALGTGEPSAPPEDEGSAFVGKWGKYPYKIIKEVRSYIVKFIFWVWRYPTLSQPDYAKCILGESCRYVRGPEDEW